MKTNKILVAVMGVALTGFGLNNAYAVGKSTSVNISPSLSITAACAVDTTGVGSVFPSQPAGSTTIAGITMAGGNMVITCPGLAYSVAANAGLNVSAGTDVRNLKSVGATLIPYKLTIATVNWGDFGAHAIEATYADTMSSYTPKATTGAGGVGAGAGETYVISGVTTSALTGAEPPATYSDTVAVTVIW